MVFGLVAGLVPTLEQKEPGLIEAALNNIGLASFVVAEEASVPVLAESGL